MQHLDIQLFSVTGGVGARPNMYSVGGGRVRQMFEQRRSAASPVGWDKSYPLDPVEAVNNEVRTPLYKQNVSRKEMKIGFLNFRLPGQSTTLMFKSFLATRQTLYPSMIEPAYRGSY